MGKKSGKKSRADRPDATQGGPRAKVKKERVQPPHSVLPANAGEEADAAIPVAPLAVPEAAKKHGKVAKKVKTKKQDKAGKKAKQSKSDSPDETAKTSKRQKSSKAEKTSKPEKSSKPEKNSKAKKNSKADKTPKTEGSPAGKKSKGEPAASTAEAERGSTESGKSSKAAKGTNPSELTRTSQPGEVSTSPAESLTKTPAKKRGKLAQEAAKKSGGKADAGEREHTVRVAALLADDGDEAHGFARLIRAMPGIVALVEQHEAAVHRAVFDSYVTAVVEFGVDAADLAPIDIRTAAPGALTLAEPAPAAGRSGSARARDTSAESVRSERTRRPSGINSAQTEEAQPTASAAGARKSAAPDTRAKPEQVRSPRSSVRASTRPGAEEGRASTPRAETEVAVGEGRAGVPAIASRTRAGARSGSARRSRVAAQTKGLEELAAELRPTNNGQRIALAIASILGADGDVSPATIAREFERMTWRVPVNVAASVRQAARAGLVDLDGPTGTRLTPAGDRYVTGG